MTILKGGFVFFLEKNRNSGKNRKDHRSDSISRYLGNSFDSTLYVFLLIMRVNDITKRNEKESTLQAYKYYSRKESPISNNKRSRSTSNLRRVGEFLYTNFSLVLFTSGG